MLLAFAPEASAAKLSCGAVVTTDTVLRHDLTACPGNGISVVADTDLTLDLNGHRVTGTANGVGIDVSAASGATVTVKDGVVTGFGAGVAAASSTVPFGGHVVVRRVTAARNGTGFSLREIGVLVANSEALWNYGVGISATPSASPVRIERSQVMHNGGDGIDTPFSEPGLIAHNNVIDNGGIGIFTTDATTSVIDNVASRNGSHGIFVTDDVGIFFPYLFQGNSADANGGYGIAFISDFPTGPNGETVDGGHNSARKNAAPAQCVNVVCSKR